jgi:NAD/NADP transhydrogenase beta subunit
MSDSTFYGSSVMPVVATIFSLSQILNYFSGFQLAECGFIIENNAIDVEIVDYH